MDYKKLSKEISYALRHEPAKYGLTPDSEGYVAVEDLLSALNKSGKYGRDVTVEDFEYIISHSDKVRHEICGDRIRALYGHSTPEKIVREPIIPPDVLYHGTTHSAVPQIMKTGLKSMKRQYVHLSKDIETAVIVGKRRDHSPVILLVEAKKAHENGISFYMGNDSIILSDPIPPEYISVQE